MRYRTPARVMEEARYLQQCYQINFISFSDEEMLASTRHLTGVCSAMGALGLSYAASGRADLMTREKALLLKNSGCHTFIFGIESGSQHILDCANKNVRVEKITTGLKAAQEVGLNFFPNFILGLPEETPDTVQETIRFCKDNGLEFASSYFTLYPNSLLFHQNRHRIVDWQDYFKKLSHGDYTWDVMTNLTTMSDAQLRYWHARGLAETAAHRLASSWGDFPVWLLRMMFYLALRVLEFMPKWVRMWMRNVRYYRSTKKSSD